MSYKKINTISRLPAASSYAGSVDALRRHLPCRRVRKPKRHKINPCGHGRQLLALCVQG